MFLRTPSLYWDSEASSFKLANFSLTLALKLVALLFPFPLDVVGKKSEVFGEKVPERGVNDNDARAEADDLG